METSQNHSAAEDPNQDLQRTLSFAGADGNQKHEIESDAATLEPFDDKAEHRLINTDDAADMFYWASEFQISVADLKAAIVLNGNSVREVKKYLSI
ncbi:DUF3606 domain-containing protein [Pedobacter frigiditerrae]|uniref:DUF3606 domain-containing protein n=1 Tax=Pedobacter frigiditerrae TaxID=2530452 RepID=A0A4R0MN72_9SPHI|nr:DUF3606 domain-containing protein [Pedobacter frigiditerrae]TCC88073.1 DUF3606 domain-containing protein [Pedobacter frigiditerrae]